MATPAARRTPGRCVSKYDQHISQYRCPHGRHHLPGRPYPQHIRVHNGFWNGEALHFAWISARRRTGTPSARRSTRGSRSSSLFWRPCASPPCPSPREDVAPRVERPSLGGPGAGDNQTDPRRTRTERDRLRQMHVFQSTAAPGEDDRYRATSTNRGQWGRGYSIYVRQTHPSAEATV